MFSYLLETGTPFTHAKSVISCIITVYDYLCIFLDGHWQVNYLYVFFSLLDSPEGEITCLDSKHGDVSQVTLGSFHLSSLVLVKTMQKYIVIFCGLTYREWTNQYTLNQKVDKSTLCCIVSIYSHYYNRFVRCLTDF